MIAMPQRFDLGTSGPHSVTGIKSGLTPPTAYSIKDRETYVGLPFPSPFLDPQRYFSTGINFSAGGSGLLDSTGQKLNIISLNHQIWQFSHFPSTLVKRDGSIAIEFYLSKSLYCISIGGNDIESYIQNATYKNTTTPRDLVTLLLSKYEQCLTMLYRYGARKFLLSDISTVGCTPSARLLGYSIANGKCLNIVNKLAKEYDSGLKKLLKRTMQNLQGTIILRPNSYKFILSVIENDEAYGFGEMRSVCCGGGAFNTQDLPTQQRGDAIRSMVYEASERI